MKDTAYVLRRHATHKRPPASTEGPMHYTRRRPESVGMGGALVDLLHLGGLLVVLLDGEAELDHAVDAAGEGGGLVEREARGEQRGLEEQVHEVLDRLVALVGGALGLELLHDRVLG